MKSMVAAKALLAAVYAAALAAPWLAPAHYAEQFRDHAGERPSTRFPLGVDELGRDRLSRLIYGSRVSLALAPAAAALATALGAVAGLAAAALGRGAGAALTLCIDLVLSLPLLFLLLIGRALLPLNAGPWASVLITFLLLGALGWPAAARVFRASAHAMTRSGFFLQARASGSSLPRILWTHLVPNLRPVAAAQFWVLVPLFILAEANLGILGLGVAEPLPSWGSLLAEINSVSTLAREPYQLAPAGVLLVILACLHIAEPRTGPAGNVVRP